MEPIILSNMCQGFIYFFKFLHLKNVSLVLQSAKAYLKLLQTISLNLIQFLILFPPLYTNT